MFIYLTRKLDVFSSTIVEIYKVYMTMKCMGMALKSTIVEIYKVYMTQSCRFVVNDLQ